MTTEAIELADMIDRSEETTGFERRMASVLRSQAAEIERLREILARKDALIRRAWSVIRWQCFGECRTPGVAGLPTAAEVDDEIKTELGE